MILQYLTGLVSTLVRLLMVGPPPGGTQGQRTGSSCSGSSNSTNGTPLGRQKLHRRPSASPAHQILAALGRCQTGLVASVVGPEELLQDLGADGRTMPARSLRLGSQRQMPWALTGKNGSKFKFVLYTTKHFVGKKQQALMDSDVRPNTQAELNQQLSMKAYSL